MSSQERKKVPQAAVKKKRKFICHYCHKPGHIRPFCYKMKHDYAHWKKSQMLPKMFHNISHNTHVKKPTVRKVWVPKIKVHCNVVYTSLKANTAGHWYFDSGCSRHMTGSKDFLTDYVEHCSGRVTYGGGAKGRIIGKGTLNVEGLPKLRNVLHVEGLNSNLISISQLCDDDLFVKFDKDSCEVFDKANTCIISGIRSSDNCYQLEEDQLCHKVSELNLWHQKLGHANFKTLKNLSKYDAVRGLPNLSTGTSYVCGACQKGKQIRVANQMLQYFGTTRCLELLHMDLMDPMEVESLGGKKYSFVCVDDFSRFCWISFLREKSDTFESFKKLLARITNLHNLKVSKIRTDHGKEFENSHFLSLCERKGITHEFAAPKTPQQNGIAERKNRTLQEMARVMLTSKNISKRFCAEALNTAVHISNRVYLRSGSTMTSYEILIGKRPNLKYFHVFGCVCYVLNDRDHLAKFDSKSDKCLFLGYSSNSHAYRMFNLRTRTTMESVNVVFDDNADLAGGTMKDNIGGLLDTSAPTSSDDVVPDVTTSETTSGSSEAKEDSVLLEEDALEDEVFDVRHDIPSKIQKDHPTSQIIGIIHGDMLTRRKEKVDYRKMIGMVCMSSIFTQVLNKIDLPGAEPDRVSREIEEIVGLDCSEAIHCSAKEGIGITEILNSIVQKMPPPQDTAERPLRALIFDSYYDAYRGVIVYFRLIDGTLKKGDRIFFMASGKDYYADEVGVLSPNQLQVEELFAGEVGYLSASIRSVADARVGDTITHYSRKAEQSLPGYKEATPMVFCGLFPVDADQFHELRDALDKLQLNDAALKFEPETSSAMGFGFRCGFLGLLHMEIVQERLEREYNLSLITTAPSVVYRVNCANGDTIECSNPSLLPEPGNRRSIEEPFVKIEMLTPKEYIGALMELAQDRRGEFTEMKFITESRASIIYRLPLAEMVGDFFDQLKSKSKGYASMEYSFIGYKESDLIKLDIQINGDLVEPLSTIVHKDKAYPVGRALTQKLKELIPRQMFKIPIQACIGSKVIASETLSAIRKDVLAKCYGGDITRKKKLLRKQAEGKKRMKAIGKVDVPQEAFMAVLKLEKEVL